MIDTRTVTICDSCGTVIAGLCKPWPHTLHTMTAPDGVERHLCTRECLRRWAVDDMAPRQRETPYAAPVTA